MKAIVNVDENWGIGLNNKLINPISEDLKLFQALTINNIVVMGLNTFLSLPGQKALPKRTNIVLTTKKDWAAPDVTVCHSIDELLEFLEQFDSANPVYVIGGASVYKQLLPYCDTVHVTKVRNSKPADSFFPNLDKDPNWYISSDSGEIETNGIKYSFMLYNKTK